jgi:hypothetical protein
VLVCSLLLQQIWKFSFMHRKNAENKIFLKQHYMWVGTKFPFLHLKFTKYITYKCWWWIDEWIWSIGGIILIGENLSTQRKICPSATLSIKTPMWTGLELWLGFSGDKLATNHLSCRNIQIPWYRSLLVLTSFSKVVERKKVTSNHHYQNYAKLVV